MSAHSTADIIRAKLAVLSPTQFELQDDSALHAGHRGNSGGSHFNLTIRSEKFNGLSPVQRHRLIFDLLRDEMRSSIHALSIRAIAADE
jgi:BolA protein